MLLRRFGLAALLAAALLGGSTGPSPGQPAAPRPDRLRAVASFSILGDLVRQVGGERVEVATLVGPNGDAHVFTPSPADTAKLTAARVIVVNGLGLEGWMDRLVGASGTKAAIVVASKSVKPIEEDGHGHDHGDRKGAHRPDPHAWQSIANTKLYVAAIRDGLGAADPAGGDAYTANAARYLAELDALEGEVRAAVARIPPESRKVITTHDAFGYFARTYGLRFIALQGVSTESEASAKDVARIVRQIRRERVPAVFLENVSDPRLIERIARESGAKVGERIYSDALSEPGGPAATYIDMMRHNIRAFSAALSS